LYAYKDSTVKKIVRRLKNKRDYQLAHQCADVLAQWYMNDAAVSHIINHDVRPMVIPVPISSQRRRERGYNQADLLARHFARTMNYHYTTQGIIKHTNSKQALVTSRTSRIHNVRDDFMISDPKLFHNQDIIIIDDVTTTGATLRELIRVLKKAGATSVTALAFAH